MTNDEIANLLIEAETYLKLTSAGYTNHTTSWYQSQTTNWYKGLSRIEQAITELKKVITTTVIALSGTTQSGKQLTATIKVS